MDWNHDGRIDYKDHAFYNNVVEPGMKKTGNISSVNGNNKQSYEFSSTEGSGTGAAIFIVICVLYLIIKLIGDYLCLAKVKVLNY